jgi:hypothetical protein
MSWRLGGRGVQADGGSDGRRAAVAAAGGWAVEASGGSEQQQAVEASGDGRVGVVLLRVHTVKGKWRWEKEVVGRRLLPKEEGRRRDARREAGRQHDRVRRLLGRHARGRNRRIIKLYNEYCVC